MATIAYTLNPQQGYIEKRCTEAVSRAVLSTSIPSVTLAGYILKFDDQLRARDALEDCRPGRHDVIVDLGRVAEAGKAHKAVSFERRRSHRRRV